jgi:hypothetical protein
MDRTPTTSVMAYWVFTVLAALLFAVPGVALLLRVPHFTADIAHLGYPDYFLMILGAWKLLGVLAILAPGLPRVKEWAYAGMFFDLTSAVISRTVIGGSFIKMFPPLVVIAIVFLSWQLRPAERVLRST